MLYQTFQVAVTGRDHAGIDSLGLVGSQGSHLLIFENAQQLSLQIQRNLADLIEKEYAAVSFLKQTQPVLSGVGESATEITEELAFEQSLGHGGAVERNERPVGTRAVEMNSAGDHFFSRATFARN